MTEEADAIEVNASPWPDQAWAGLRQIAPAVLAFAVGRHLIADDMATMLAVVGGFVWAFVASQLKTRKRANQLIAVAGSDAVPDAVARIK